MDVILDRVLDFLSAENLAQTPVLGGKGRGEKDLLGQRVAPSSFSVSVKGIRGKDIILRGDRRLASTPVVNSAELQMVPINPGYRYTIVRFP
jgi:hypothetical protein